MAKNILNGPKADPSYEYLRHMSPLRGRMVKWNFTQFLLNSKGKFIYYYYRPIYLHEKVFDHVEKYFRGEKLEK
jgi:glutathione peroxidase-family protein